VKDSLDYNVYGNYSLIKHLLPEIIKGKTEKSRGKILVLQSMLESYISPYNGFYGVTRHALRGLFDILNMELKISQLPVRVTKIIPGVMNVSLFWEMKQSKLDWLRVNNSLFTRGMAVDTHHDNTEARMKVAASVEFISKHFYQCLEQDQPKAKVWGGNPIFGFLLKTLMRNYKPGYWKKADYLETKVET
jgi:short-subunit dehydrogenase